MKSLNPSPENFRRNGVIGLGLMPNHGPTTINIKVSHGLNQYEVFMPSSSNFGYLKSLICQKIGLRSERHKLFYGATEKEEDEDLQTAGLTDNSELLLQEGKADEQESPEENQEIRLISKGEEAVVEVRKDVDKLAQRVSELQALVEIGDKVHDKEIVHLTEMLMRQLLKLDGIEAEGEGKVQRRMEVHRVQTMVEILDVMKSRNSNAFSNMRKSLSASKIVYASLPLQSYPPSPVQPSASIPMPSSSKI